MNKTEQYILERLDNLERAFLMSQRRNVDNTFKAENANSKVEALTPYIDSVRAYIGDTSVKFDNVFGNIVTTYCETDGGLVIPTRIERVNNTVNVFFEPLEEVATVTISVI